MENIGKFASLAFGILIVAFAAFLVMASLWGFVDLVSEVNRKEEVRSKICEPYGMAKTADDLPYICKNYFDNTRF